MGESFLEPIYNMSLIKPVKLIDNIVKPCASPLINDVKMNIPSGMPSIVQGHTVLNSSGKYI
jgi:hypothetical protein